MTAAPALHFPQEDFVHDRPAQQVDSGDLWKWVDRLTRDRRHRLVRQARGAKATVEYVDIPSLWTQLTEAVASTNSGGGRGKSSTGSRAPIDLATEALLIEISSTVADALNSHDHRPRVQAERLPSPRPRSAAAPRLRSDDGAPAFDPDLAGRLVERAARVAADDRAHRDLARFQHDTRSDLRQLATVVVGTRDQDLVDWWVGQYRTWVSRAETVLLADDESIDVHGVRGHACPVCLALWVTSERDGAEFRDPALVIAFRDGQVQHITCRACQTGWWRGGDVDELTEQIAMNTAVYGDASLWGETVPKTGRMPA